MEWERLVTTHRVSGKNTYDARIVAAMNVHRITGILTVNVQDFTRYPENFRSSSQDACLKPHFNSPSFSTQILVPGRGRTASSNAERRVLLLGQKGAGLSLGNLAARLRGPVHRQRTVCEFQTLSRRAGSAHPARRVCGS